MAEEFLEEQLKRIREMTERFSHVKPLHDLHEVRNHSSEPHGPAREKRPSVRKHSAHDVSRRRGR
jgi:hypothetical protein